ncbi:putative reverse transcriptase zinc-binding domain-containing protein [Helianthus annuus]|nr:putative reverse transcriptase zinc-binding domain-containing protein [Helianthus annuus]
MAKRGLEIEKNLISKIGNGDKTMFWIDVWTGDKPLRENYPHLYEIAKNKRAKVEDNHKRINGGVMWDWAWAKIPSTEQEKKEAEELMAILSQTNLSRNSDRWVWKGENDQEFSVKEVRITLSRSIDLNEPPDNYFWNNWAAQKCSMFVWRAVKGRIPTATQLRERGVPIPSGRCRLCDNEEETPDHVLVRCREAKGVWEQIGQWVKLQTITQKETLEEILSVLDEQVWEKKKKAVHAIFLLTTWIIWKNRNEKIFQGRNGEIYKMIEEIKEESFLWMKHKSKVQSISWESWIYFSW